MAQNFNDYLVSAMQEAGLSDDQVTAAFTKLANHEKIGPKLNGILKTATEDYQAQVGRVQALQTENTKLTKEWYPQVVQAHQNLQSEYDKAMAEIQRLQGGGTPQGFDASKYMTKDDVARVEQGMATRFASAIKETGRLASRHAVQFKEELDFDAVDKIAQEKNLPIAAAYDEYIKPRQAAAEVEARKKWEQDKTAEIERDLRSRMNLPTDPTPPATSHLFSKPPADSLPKDVDADLLSTWHSAGKNAA